VAEPSPERFVVQVKQVEQIDRVGIVGGNKCGLDRIL
jgi:hypothetical protein